MELLSGIVHIVLRCEHLFPVAVFGRRFGYRPRLSKKTSTNGLSLQEVDVASPAAQHVTDGLVQ